MTENEITTELLKSNTSELVPESLIKAARNPEKVEVMPVRKADDELNFIVVEHGYGGQTDETEWNSWLEEIKDAKEKGAGSRIVFMPTAPSGVDRLHARFRSDIEDGRFSLEDRILLTCKLKIHNDGENMLYVGDYDGEKGLGVAVEFYTKTLPKLAEQLGIKFITGQNNGANLSFFTNKLGRYTYWQLKPEARAKLFPDINPQSNMGEYTTIQFLDTADEKEYVNGDEIK